MGANIGACLNKDLVQETIDDYFVVNYVWLFLATLQTFLPFGFLMAPINIVMFFVVEVYMNQMGALVDCAIRYQTLGNDTESRFTWLSSYYSAYALMSLLYGSFIEPMISTTVYLGGPITIIILIQVGFFGGSTFIETFNFFTLGLFGLARLLYIPFFTILGISSVAPFFIYWPLVNLYQFITTFGVIVPNLLYGNIIYEAFEPFVAPEVFADAAADAAAA